MTSLTIDRLKIFVSSTINECWRERAIVKKAIRSLNHDPVLFEDIGARAHPPREVYKARLEESQIFIGIYRESYGWIAPGMQISGVEDEFHIAAKGGMDRLIYVYKPATDRDLKLAALIETAKNSGLVVFSYSDPEQLRLRVRDDITAVISNRFMDQAVVSSDAPKPSEVLDALLPNYAHRFRRRQVESELLRRMQDNPRVVINGPLGSGKTVLLAQLAVENNWIFIDGQGLSRLDLLARAANAFRERLGQGPITLTTEGAAARELLDKAEAVRDLVLAVDSVEDPMVLWDLPVDALRLVLTSRSTLGMPVEQRFDVPPLSREEIDTWATRLRGLRPNPKELLDLVARSNGNPLYLRFYGLGGNQSEDLPLRELEMRAIQSLPPHGKEITSYLALSTRALSLGDLQSLMGSDQGPEFVAEQIATASGLVRQTRGRVQLVHEHLRATLLAQLQQDTPRMAFFSSRLGRYFEQTGKYVAAFHVYVESGEPRHVDRVLSQAVFQAALMGGGAPAIPIFRRKVELARQLGHYQEEIHDLLMLASALKQVGDRIEASRALEDARDAAERQKDEHLVLRVREVELAVDLSGAPREERIRELLSIRESYKAAGSAFDSARVATSLASEYISGSGYVHAETMSRETLGFFTSIGDEYGVRVSRLNLAAALSGMNGREQEAARIFQELQQDLDPDEYPRERAAVCNFLTRHYRRAGDTNRARAFGVEAIRISEDLGDLHLVAINRINLGNVCRDESALDEALAEYRSADQAAVAGANLEDEASANELIASMLNAREQYALALKHAEHAVRLAGRVGDSVLIARTEEERARALKGEREFDDAINAYSNAAKALAAIPQENSYFVSLVADALALCATLTRPDLRTRLIRSIFAPELESENGAADVTPLRAYYAALPSITRMVPLDRLPLILALSMGNLLGEASPLVERRILIQAVDKLLEPREGIDPRSVLMAVAAVLMAHSGTCLTTRDLVHLAERLARFSSRIHFKPRSDGAAHWTVRLEIADGVIVTVAQLDDVPRIGVTTMILAVLLASLDQMIGKQVLEAERIPRHEVMINVVSRADLEANIEPSLLDLGEMSEGFSIAESSDVTTSDQPPIVVVCGAEFGKPWRPDSEPFADPTKLLAEVLRVLVGYLLARAVEPDVLFPKIADLIRSLGYRGAETNED